MAGRKLVILGGGFGGLDVARSIGRSRTARDYWDTVLIDKENYFQFNPLLPAVAVGAVETRHIVYPLREMARHRHIRFYKNKVIDIDLARRQVVLHNNLRWRFDTLVIAVGSVTDYYGVPGAAQFTRPFKTLVDAMTLRARVVELFEMAEQSEGSSQRQRLLSFAIVGGGVTGVEVAAEIMDMVRETLLPRYPSLHRSQLSVTLVEAGDRLVNTARPEHSAYVQRFLERRGVQIRLGANVARVEDKALRFADGGSLEAFTILWTAGVRPPELVQRLPLLHAPDGRVRVDEYLRALDANGQPVEDVWVIGDCAAAEKAEGGFQPRLAQTAVAMGGHVGEALVRRSEGKAIPRFGFREPGYIISLGKHSSVVELFGVPIAGKLAWLFWAAAYLVKMVGIRKQLEVGIDHLIHLFFEHDSSQIMNRRQILSDAELNLSLGDEEPRREAQSASR
ncbi:MAG TPA: NAD(P)/FAD-dependent oxidoreductase [Candidatus Limnocylindria bacterium]|nr:NAD(P)/FAD-dependent oxidoreductase [Candidatus Limnocylindria bacterium]